MSAVANIANNTILPNKVQALIDKIRRIDVLLGFNILSK